MMLAGISAVCSPPNEMPSQPCTSSALRALGLLGLLLSARGQLFPAQMELADLTGSDGFVLQGDKPGDKAGWSVAGLGDVNGDGINDLMVGAYSGDASGRKDAGRAYVLYGKAGLGRGGSIGLGHLNRTEGLVIDGAVAGDECGFAVAGASDINSDGIADLAVVARYADAFGKTYVVFGGKNLEEQSFLDLAKLPADRGLTLHWTSFGPTAISSAGDINGDRVADLLIGAPSVFGHTYVLLGKAGLKGLLSRVDLAIQGELYGDATGWSVAEAGDVNGDGVDDIIIGARDADPTPARSEAGKAYLIFGNQQLGSKGPPTLSSLDGANGVIFNGQDSGDHTGVAVSGTGDVNGDGFDDILIGAAGATPSNGLNAAGKTYVVFGRKTFDPTLELSSLNGTHGFVLNGAGGIDFSGAALSGGRDINGDGTADIVVGVPWAGSIAGRFDAGKTYVVFGHTALGKNGTIELASLNGESGFVLNGDAAGDHSGASVSAVGDVNADGISDLLIGAPGETSAGKAYVVFGRNTTSTTASVFLTLPPAVNSIGQSSVAYSQRSPQSETSIAISHRFFNTRLIETVATPASSTGGIAAIVGGLYALASIVGLTVLVFFKRRQKERTVNALEDLASPNGTVEEEHHYQNFPRESHYSNIASTESEYEKLQLRLDGKDHYTSIDEVNRQHDEYESARLARAQENYDDIPRGARS